MFGITIEPQTGGPDAASALHFKQVENVLFQPEERSLVMSADNELDIHLHA